jgi:hypothetical protein
VPGVMGFFSVIFTSAGGGDFKGSSLSFIDSAGSNWLTERFRLGVVTASNLFAYRRSGLNALAAAGLSRRGFFQGRFGASYNFRGVTCTCLALIKIVGLEGPEKKH